MCIRDRHELELIVRRQHVQVLKHVALAFAGLRRLQVDDAADPRIDPGDVESAARLERNRIARLTQRSQQLETRFLRQRPPPLSLLPI